MVDQTTTKLMGMIKDLKMYVHGIPYIATFTILENTIVNSNYSMLFCKPWFKDVKVTHDWGITHDHHTRKWYNLNHSYD
jgi:hypothetical protein